MSKGDRSAEGMRVSFLAFPGPRRRYAEVHAPSPTHSSLLLWGPENQLYPLTISDVHIQPPSPPFSNAEGKGIPGSPLGQIHWEQIN